ncbi:hypothetical protein PHYC_01451 [Phycisphaerales bacterium]|nr:hypothetical protein PHYC_01451 [Phycisphaerales bacterium]
MKPEGEIAAVESVPAHRAHVLYPRLYVWYLFASSLDIIMTYAIVWKLGGSEVNAVARHFIEHFEHWGLIFLKYTTVVLVVAICELAGRKSQAAGRRLAFAAIVLSAFPVGYGIVQVLAWTHAWE